MDPTYPLLPIMNIICCFLVLLPLPWLFKSWNVGVCMYSLWTFVACLCRTVNSIVWARSAHFAIPVWCDISSRIVIGYSVAIPAASLTITRRIYGITAMRSLQTTKEGKRNELIVDLCICLVLPCVIMALYYIVQPSRFVIWEEAGCFPSVANVGPAFPLVLMWPTFLATFSVIYCPLIVWKFLKHRRAMNEFLSSNPSINHSKYFRIIALGSIDAYLTLPLSIFIMWYNAVPSTSGLSTAWPGWDAIHEDFSEVDLVPASVWRANNWQKFSILWNEWVAVACGFVFFVFFGLSADARSSYKRVLWAIAKPFGKELPSEKDNSSLSFARNERLDVGANNQSISDIDSADYSKNKSPIDSQLCIELHVDSETHTSKHEHESIA